MDFLDVLEEATIWGPIKGGDEGENTVEELEAFVFRKGDMMVFKVPEEAEECGCRGKDKVTLVWMPWDIER